MEYRARNRKERRGREKENNRRKEKETEKVSDKRRESLHEYQSPNDKTKAIYTKLSLISAENERSKNRRLN